MGKIYTVANRKGGCSKTTTVGALASCLTKMGLKVLVVDTDPQGNLTKWSGLQTDGLDTMREVLLYECDPNDAIYEIKGRYDLIPADKDLWPVETVLQDAMDRYTRLREVLAKVKDDYDIVIVDTPPSLGTFTLSAFTACDGGIVLTTDSGAFATEGMIELAESLVVVRKTNNPDIDLVGILLTKFNPRYKQHKVIKETSEKFSQYFDAPIYNTFIRQGIAVTEAQGDCADLMGQEFKNTVVYKDYLDFATEFAIQQGLIEELSDKEDQE